MVCDYISMRNFIHHSIITNFGDKIHHGFLHNDWLHNLKILLVFK